jgi:Peptidase S46
MKLRILTIFTLIVIFPPASTPLHADEGLWLYNHFPAKQVQNKYGFLPTQEWLDHLQLGSVRFNNGGSGSFVSANGLTFTNHHVAQTCLAGLSTAQKDLYQSGFYAKTEAEEARCPDLELNQLTGIKDVTAQVQGAVKPAMAEAQAERARQAVSAEIENECVKTTGLRCDVVTLYAGGMYNLCKYKSTPMSGWYLRRSSVRHFLEDNPPISNIRDTTSTLPSSAFTRTASRRIWVTII